MRIIAGNLRGSSLHITKNKNTRPLKDLARESIFNLLTHSNKVVSKLEKSSILDLYAGTGSFGLECLSRQSKYVCFVEKDKSALQVLEKNIEKLKLKQKTKIFSNDVFDLIKNPNTLLTKYDLIFCDPPFKDSNIGELIELIFDKKLLHRNGTIIIHRNKTTKDNLPKYFYILDERVYGESKIVFGKILS